MHSRSIHDKRARQKRTNESAERRNQRTHPSRRTRTHPLRRLQQTHGNQVVQRLAVQGIQPKLEVGPPNDRYEREADHIANRVVRMPGSASKSVVGHGMPAEYVQRRTAEVGTEQGIHGALQRGGRPLPSGLQAQFESRFGTDLGAVRLHTDDEAALAADALQARAFTTGQHVYFGSQSHPTDHALLAHELVHTVQNRDVVARREATFAERRAWLSFFDHYLPRKFLNNYMDDTGRRITLSQREMEDCNPVVDLRRSTAFMQEVSRLQSAGGGHRAFTFTGWGGAMTNGTLGNFTIHYDGTLVVAPDGTWTFTGTMWFEDYWDFNPGGANRPVAAEVKVLVANTLLPGRPFPIDSVRVAIAQTNSQNRAQWGAAAPTHVPDRAGTTGADIEVGAVEGAPLGPTGDVAGAEVGAQASEDIN